jgi:hypothetical protein
MEKMARKYTNALPTLSPRMHDVNDDAPSAPQMRIVHIRGHPGDGLEKKHS